MTRQPLRPVMLLFCGAFLGCGDDESASSTDGPATGSGGSEPTATTGSGSGGAPGAGGEGGGAGGADPPQTLAGWTEGPSLSQRRDHHLTFTVETSAGAFLFAAAGVEDNATLFDDVEVAAIAADGTLAPWTAGTALPQVMGGAGVGVVGRVVVVAGGYRLNGQQPTLSRATDISVVGEDGSLGAWSEGPQLGATRFHHAMVATGDQVFVLGGLTGNNTVQTPMVERATVSADGTISAWSETTPLPRELSHHSVTAHEGALYLTGGLEGDPASPGYEVFADVLRAPILEDGSLGDWVDVGDLPHTLSTHASFVHGGFLHVVGGTEGDHMNTQAVRRAPIEEDGSVGAFEDLPAVPSPRAHAHHTPTLGSFVYAVGGALNHDSIAEVFIGRFE